jgi:hypothetical protein
MDHVLFISNKTQFLDKKDREEAAAGGEEGRGKWSG